MSEGNRPLVARITTSVTLPILVPRQLGQLVLLPFRQMRWRKLFER